MLPTLDLRAISGALFLPLLYWTGAVLTISQFGYPGVVCMTPLAWLLAVPVGLRVQRESTSAGRGPVIEAAIGGALLGLWQGLLFAIAMLTMPVLLSDTTVQVPRGLLASLAVLAAGIPVTGSLAAWTAWRKRQSSA